MTRTEIEQLCIQRNREELLPAVTRYVKKGGDREYSDGMEWLWRAGMFKEVLLLSIPKNASSQSLNVERLGVERSLWIARAWSALGAWPYAEQILRRIPSAQLISPESRVIASSVLSSLGYYVESLALLPRVLPKDWGDGWRWQAVVQEMFCLTQLDQAEGVLTCVRNLRENSPDVAEGNQIHLLAIEAYTEGLLKGPAAGVEKLRLFKNQHPELASTHPRISSFSDRWLAVFLGRLGRREESTREFYRVLRGVRKESVERLPQNEMYILALLEHAGFAPSSRVRERLQIYPGLSRPAEMLLGTRSSERLSLGDPEKSEIHVDLGNGECRVGGALRPSTPLELVLASIIARAGKNGIGVSLLYCLLWPEEAWNWLQFSERLAKLISRLRKTYGISITRKRECLRLTTRAEQSRISISFSSSSLPSFLVRLTDDQKAKGFRSSEVARFYDLSDRHALNFVSQWVEQGWVRREGKGPRLMYKPAINP